MSKRMSKPISGPMSRVCPISPHRPEPDRIQRAARILAAGGVVILPTRGLYGLGCDIRNADAVGRIFHIKKRLPDKPLLVLISHPRMLTDVVASVSPLAEKLMTAFWPGRVTLVMQGRKDLPAGLRSVTGKVGVRRVGHPVAAALVAAAGTPITGTSANVSDAGGCDRIDAIDDSVIASVDMILDAGILAGGPGSSVVDVTGRVPRILREGAVAAADIVKAAGATGPS
jgi:L-threonylcarbamoyladenylate synthase